MNYQIALRHYYYFKVLTEELHYRKAAARLFISQPGLTRQINQMEEQLGVKLFERNKRNVELTQAGQYLAKEVEYIFSYIEKVQADIVRISAARKIQLRIGFVGSAAHVIIPRFIHQLTDKKLEVETLMDEMSNTTQIEALQKGSLDLGFLRISQAPAGLSIRVLQEETFSLVVPDNFKKPANKSNLLKSLRHTNFILFSSSYSEEYYNLIMNIFTEEGFTPQVLHRSVNAVTIFKLVEQGLGVAIIPTSLQDGYNLKVKFIELTHIPHRTKIAVAWNPRNRNPGIKPALKILTEGSGKN